MKFSDFVTDTFFDREIAKLFLVLISNANEAGEVFVDTSFLSEKSGCNLEATLTAIEGMGAVESFKEVGEYTYIKVEFELFMDYKVGSVAPKDTSVNIFACKYGTKNGQSCYFVDHCPVYFTEDEMKDKIRERVKDFTSVTKLSKAKMVVKVLEVKATGHQRVNHYVKKQIDAYNSVGIQGNLYVRGGRYLSDELKTKDVVEGEKPELLF